MQVVEIHGQTARGITVITRHHDLFDAACEYVERERAGQTGIHKETGSLAPWQPTTCTHHPKPKPQREARPC